MGLKDFAQIIWTKFLCRNFFLNFLINYYSKFSSCNLPNGSYVTEGAFVKLKDDELKPSVDVVFLMESKDCNAGATKKLMLNTFVKQFTQELKTQSINEVRFSVMTFGGSGEYEKPKSITSDGKVFTDAKNIKAYFDHLKTDKGSKSDVFSVVTKASELIFKPGAVKVFVLSLCSECQLNLLKVCEIFLNFICYLKS